MDFLVIGLDRPDAGDLRSRIRPAHIEYVRERQSHIKYAGPILDEAGEMRGSVLILTFADRAALDRHLAADPYFRENLFEAVFVRATRQVMPEGGT